MPYHVTWHAYTRTHDCAHTDAGSMVGFGDPFATIGPSVFHCSALKKCEALVFERRVLWQARCVPPLFIPPKSERLSPACSVFWSLQMLVLFGEEQAVEMCSTIEAEYNKLMDRMKAKEHKITRVTPPL
eukprot:996576-Prymnesium_polylepis.1